MTLIVAPNIPRDYRGLLAVQEGGIVQWEITSTNPSLGEAVQISPGGNAFAPGTPVQIINFAAGSENPQYATFTSLDDKTHEVDERFYFQFQPIGNTALNVAENGGAIVDNDPLPAIAINAQQNTLLENATDPNFKFDLTRVGEDLNVTTDVAVAFRTTGPTPADQDDFGTSLDTQVIRFAPGETTKTISLTIHNDDVIEPTDSLSAVILSATSTSPTMYWPTTQYDPITKGSVTFSILNDDPKPPVPPDTDTVVTSNHPPPAVDVYRFYNTQTNTHFFTASELERDIVRNTLSEYRYEGVGFTAVPEQPGSDPIFRFYNTQTNTHFFTPSVQERDSVIENLKQYNYEGVGFHASTQNAAGLTEVYRFYNSDTQTHFYTPSILERGVIQSTLPQYHFEGVGFWVPDSPDYLLS